MCLSGWRRQLPTNNVKVVVKIVKKNIFSRCGTPGVIISNKGSHFVNHWFKNILAKYKVSHKVSTVYHPYKWSSQSVQP